MHLKDWDLDVLIGASEEAQAINGVLAANKGEKRSACSADPVRSVRITRRFKDPSPSVSDSPGAGPRDYQIEAVALPACVRDGLAAHAERAYPNEACGAILGHARGIDAPVVTRTVPLRNSEPRSGEGYRIHPDDLHELLSADGRREERLVGFYHSHPDRAGRPSEADLRDAVPGLLYVCVSVRAGRAGARTTWSAVESTGRIKQPSREGSCPN